MALEQSKGEEMRKRRFTDGLFIGALGMIPLILLIAWMKIHGQVELIIVQDGNVTIEEKYEARILELEDAMLLETCGSRKDWITDDLNNQLVACQNGETVDLTEVK